MRYSRRWEQFGTSIFSIMSQKAAAAGAINLAQGFPDFDGPEAIKLAAQNAILTGKNQYCPSTGTAQLRQKLAERQARKYGLQYDPETEVTVFSGATEALFCALSSLFEPHDEIICFEPYYDSYPAGAFASGAKLKGVPLSDATWRLDKHALESAITQRTRALLVNTPHNPTGMMLNAEERQFLADLAIKHDLLVITDEVYEEIIFETQHVPLATLPGMADRTVTISSFSKTFSMTGWKVGFAFAPLQISKQLRALHQFTVFCSATPLLEGMVAALDLSEEYFVEFRTTYLERRDLMSEVLSEAGFKLRKPEGSYFILANYERFSQLPDMEFADELIAKAGVATVPISPFYADSHQAANLRYLRFAFCKDEKTILAAGKRLMEAFK